MLRREARHIARRLSFAPIRAWRAHRAREDPKRRRVQVVHRDEAERARVLADGGRIDGGRLSGYLEVSRAIGDIDVADGEKPPGLSPTPELCSRAIQPADEFIILGTDGLWDAVATDVAVKLARAELQAYSGDAVMASEKLVEAALKR